VKVNREIALIANCESLEYFDDSGQEWIIEFAPGKYGLFCSGDEREIYVLPIHKAKEIDLPKGRAGLRGAYSSFTGYEVNSALRFEIPSNKMIPVGTMQRAIYISDKWNREPTRYGHEYESDVTLYADHESPSKAKIFVARADSGRRLVSKRGLIG
jgi:hypothetical protein